MQSNDDLPRERLRRRGVGALSDAELLMLLLGSGGRGRSVGRMAQELLVSARGLRGLARMGRGQLAALPGFGDSKACRIIAAIELGRRLASRPLPLGAKLSSSAEVVESLRPRLAGSEREHFIAIPLDARNRAIGELHIATGSLTACPVSPADVFRALLREAAAGVIVVHNHPSGEPSPSAEDLALTRRLDEAGELLGVPLIDHLIVGRGGYFSFVDAGLLGDLAA